MGRDREALEAYRRSAAIGEELRRADPDGGSSPSFALLRIGDTLFRLGDYQEALSSYRRAHELRVDEVKANPDDLWSRAALIVGRAKIGRTLSRLGQTRAALAECAEAIALMERTPFDPEQHRRRRIVRRELHRAGRCLRDARRRPARAAGRAAGPVALGARRPPAQLRVLARRARPRPAQRRRRRQAGRGRPRGGPLRAGACPAEPGGRDRRFRPACLAAPDARSVGDLAADLARHAVRPECTLK